MFSDFYAAVELFSYFAPNPFLGHTVRTAIKYPVRLDAVSDNLTAAMSALRCEKMDCAFKAVKGMRLPG